MTSIFEHTTSNVTIHILHDDTLTKDNRAKFIRTAEKYSQGLRFYDVTRYKNFMSDDKTNAVDIKVIGAASIGAMYRLCLPDVVQCRKVIYLDSDIVVDIDIKELWDIDINDCCLAGVHDVSHYASVMSPSKHFRLWLMNCDAENYINAGVMLMNLDKIREKYNLFQASLQWVSRYQYLMNFGDQDIINSLFYNSIKLIDKKFNNISHVTNDDIAHTIIHTAGGNRAWEMTGLPYQPLYWKTYLLSAWGENKPAEEIIDAIAACSKSGTKRYRFTFWRKVRNVIHNSEPSVIARYAIKELAYRIKHMFSRS